VPPKPPRSLIFAALVAVLSLVFGILSQKREEPSTKPAEPVARPAGPCGPGTLPDAGVCVPVAIPLGGPQSAP